MAMLNPQSYIKVEICLSFYMLFIQIDAGTYANSHHIDE